MENKQTYRTPIKEEIYIGMPCERRVHNGGYWYGEICCTKETYEYYCNCTNEELRESLRDMFTWEPHHLTEEEYHMYMSYNENGEDPRLFDGMPMLGGIRIKSGN